MNPRHEDYERVGRWLDGEPVELTDAQRALAEEVAADAAALGPALDVSLPAGALHRAHGRLKRALPRRRRWQPLRWAAAAAAAAAVTLAVVLGRGGNGMQPSEYLECFLQAPAGELDDRADALADELAEYQVQLTLNGEWPTAVAFTGLEGEVEDLFFEETTPAGQEEWESW